MKVRISAYALYAQSVCTQHHLKFSLPFAECVRNCFITLGNMHATNVEEAQKFQDSRLLPPAQQKKIDENLVFHNQPRFSHTFDPGTNFKATITNKSDGRNFASDISKHMQGELSCGCGKPCITGLPCEHNEFHAIQCRMSAAQIVNKKLTTAGWKASYEAAVAVGGFGTVSY